ncbi:MAG TPA: LamG-like jellyroll fold domain-containing protein [Baekduia sp.]|nr:LamG-like jellyroll fold domain-containing protein [Baekduia sp.]
MRSESRTQFAAQTEDAAFATLDEAFPRVLAPVPDPIPSSDRVLKYINDEHAAIVAPVDVAKASPEARKRRMVASTLPLRVKNRDGQLAPISTDVTETTLGELRPENALVDVVVSRDLHQGIGFPGTGVAVRPVGVNADQPATVRKDRVFWANVQTDTDFMVNMLPDGVETYDVLRSQQSPERLSYEVDVPEEGSVALDADKQTIDIKDKDGRPVAHVGPSNAADADGRLVPTRWVVHGTMLQIEIDHRLADLRYPILVDPPFKIDQLSWSDGTSADFNGWVFAESNPGALAKLAGDAGLGAGLNIWLPANLTVPQGLWGAWEFGAPGDTYVSRFEMAHFYWWPLGGRSCAMGGILGSDNPISWNGGQVTGTPGPTTSPWGWCAQDKPAGVGDWYIVHQVGAGFTRGNRAAIEWLAPATAGGTSPDWIRLGGAAVEITDDQAPGDFSVFGLPAAWTKNPAVAFSAYATDHGLGMESMEVNINGDLVGEQDLGCDPDWREAVHCPATQRVDVGETVPEGINDVDVYGEDASGDEDDPGNHGWDNMGFAARVDMGPPAMSLSGPAYDLRGQDLGELSYKLHVDAQDPGPSSSIDVSGVGSIEFLVNDQRKGFVSQGCDQNCLEGDGAGLVGDFTFDASSLVDGSYTLKVKVKDRADNTIVSDPWTVNVVAGTVTGPRTGLHVPRRATLEAHARRSGITNVRWEYRTAANGGTPAGSWTTIPVTALRDSSGNQPSSTTIAVTSANSVPVSWDIMSTLGTGAQSKALDVRGVFNLGTTNASRVNFDTKGLDERTAHESIGPGTVNLLTGNFSATADDVNIAGGLAALAVNRTYNSRDAATVGALGPGWKLSAPVLDDVDVVDRIIDRWGLGYVELILGDGTSVPFTAGNGGLTPAVGYEQFSLSRDYGQQGGFSSVSKYRLTDGTSGATTILATDPNGDTGTYYPEVVQEGPPATAVTAVYETVGGKRRIEALYAPGAAESSCTGTFITGVCRALLFVYASTTTATGALPANWGDYTGRLARIDLKTIDPVTANPIITPVWNYSYDSSGRLRAAWDPRISTQKEQYGYDANGLLISYAPPGESPWTMSYTQIGGETEFGRLSQASRTVPAGSATWTVAYNLPLSGTNAPMNMSKSALDTWSQEDLPTDVTAIFPPDQVPALPTSDYTRASVHYLNRDSYEVNDLRPGGELSTTERDRYGNVVRELGARNRATALAAGSSSAARSGELDTQRTYQDNGLNLTDEVGPLHNVRLDSGAVVLARRHTVTRYDETKPAGDTANYHLPTTQIVSAQVSGPSDQDARTTTTDYDWTLHKPSKIIKGAQSGGPALTETMQYDTTTGLMIGHRQPKSPTSDAPSTTKYLYYGTFGCGNHPEWYMMMCQKGPAAQPGGSQPALPTTTYQYNRLDQVTSEARGSRVETTTYDPAGRQTGTSWTSGSGVAVPSTTIGYDSATGREATREAVVSGTLRKVEHVYDSAGQLSQYKDGTGQRTDTTYDLLGRPLTVDDGKGTQTNTYDAVTGRLKQVVDSQAGTFSATYDADGRVLTKSLPNGLRATYQYDEAGQSTDLAWVMTTGCSSGCTWLHFGVTRSIFDQQRTLDGTTSQQTDAYDGVGRLAEVRDTPSGQGCTTRKYSYGADSNRIQVSSYAPGAGGACDATSTPSQVNHAYDAADRLVDSGYVYDAQGRITTVPAGGAGEDALSSTYFDDDRVRSQSQSDITNTYDLDPARRSMVRSTSSAAGSGTETSHYSDDSDSPSWTATDDGHWSRNIGGVDGDLIATVDDSAGAVLQLTDLHGNVAAIAATSSTKVDDAQVFQPVRSGSSWSLDPTRALAPGAYFARVRQNDASGNVGDSAPIRFTVGADAGPDHSYRDMVVGDGPEAYWRLGESTGTIASDQTGAHNGTYTGGPALAQAGALISETDTSVGFDGVNDGMTALDQPWRSSTGFTVESWIKTGRRGGTLMSQGTATDNNNWKVRVEDTGASSGKVQAVYKAGPRTYTGYSSIRVDDSKWHHVVASFMPNGMTRVSVDGRSAFTPWIPVSTTPAFAYGFDEPSGTIATNSGTATSADGAITGATRTPSGRFGAALNFSSASTYVQANDTALLGSPVTVEAWVKPTAASTGVAVAKGTSFQLGTKLNTNLNPLASIGSVSATATTPTLPLNTWSHLAMTWDSTSMALRVYANGQLVQTATAPHPGFAGVLRIGALGTGFFAGSIDEVKIYKRVLSQAEIAVDQNVPVDAAAISNPSVALGLEENLGNLVADSSGNHRDVTLAGFNSWAAGKYGNGVQFNTTNYGSITDPGLATSTTGITLSSWIKTTAVQSVPFLGATTFGLYGQRSSTVGPGVCVGASCWSAPTSANGVWTHLTATYDKVTGSLRLYVNGTLTTATTIATGANLLPGGVLSIGRDTVNAQAAFGAGYVDEIRAYPRPLSAAEVAREWNLSVAKTPGGNDPNITIGNGGAANYFAGRIDDVATYGRTLTDAEIAEHNRTGSPSNKIAAPFVSNPLASPAVADATPIYNGSSTSPNVRVDVFSGTDTSGSPIQSLLSRPTVSYSAESAKGLPAGTYTAKVTENDPSGRYATTAPRTFSIAGATDPETGYATSVRSDTPLAYWRLGESSGTTAADDLTAHPATYTGSPTLGGTGALIADSNKAPTLDGVDDRADAPNTSGFFDPGTGNFSVEAWVKTTANGNEIIANKGTGWQLAVTSDAGKVGSARFTYANGAVTVYSTARVDDGNWHHIVASVLRSSYADLYVDNVIARTSIPNTTALTDSSPVRIGAGATTGGYFTGQIDEVALYNTNLNGLRILAHYRLGAQLDSVAPNPTITAPTNGSSTTNAALNFTGTAGSSTSDAAAVTLSITPDPAGGPLAVYDYDEFGTPRGPSQASRYGYLGGKQRSAELPSGVVAMGQRSYIPSLGRFLQVDPVDGGSANPYDYTNQDPVNQRDLDGRCTFDRDLLPSFRTRGRYGYWEVCGSGGRRAGWIRVRLPRRGGRCQSPMLTWRSGVPTVKESAFNPCPDWLAEHAMDIVQAAVQCYAGARQMSGATPYPALNSVSGCAIGAANPDPNGPN